MASSTSEPLASSAHKSHRLSKPIVALLSLGPIAFAAGVFLREPLISPALQAAGLTLVALAALLLLASRRGHAAGGRAVSRFVEHDASPSFTTDAEGSIAYQNRAATERFGSLEGSALLGALSDIAASPGAIVARLQTRAEAKGAAREDLATPRGHLRLSVHKLGKGNFLWRFEDIAERTAATRGSEGVGIPMLTVSKSGTVLFMNEAMRRVVGSREGTLDRIVNDLPVRPGEVHEIAAAGGPLRATLYEGPGAAGRREIYLLPAREDLPAADWQFFDALPVALLRVSRSGEVQMANRLARDLLADQMAVGTPLSSLVEGLGRPIGEWIADATEGRGLHRAEVVRATRPAKEVYLQITLGRVVENGEPSLVAVLNDATELKTLEAQFVQSQKMQAIGQLAGGVAHDFNNLLTAISGHCDLLRLRRDPTDPDWADLEQINQNANRAASLVGQLLAFSRKQNLQPQMLDLRESLSDLTHLLNRLVGEQVSLSLDHDPDLKLIRADKRQLEQVLMNLVVNARDAMPTGGTIEISTRNLTLRQPMERDRAAVPQGEWVVVRVTDEGLGIPADKLPKIFEPFYTTKRTGEGTGLGLSTAYGIVKQTGGFIFADSVVGSGTTFMLFFPAHEVSERPVAVAEPVVSGPVPVQGRGVVLLVEDEAPVRAFASRALRMRGYTVLEAENGEEALKTLDDEALEIDVFVTDVIMPGMDGPSWVRIALERRPDTRVIFVSGYAEDSIAESQARIPNAVFLPKPFSLSDLTATVQAQMQLASAEPSASR